MLAADAYLKRAVLGAPVVDRYPDKAPDAQLVE